MKTPQNKDRKKTNREGVKEILCIALYNFPRVDLAGRYLESRKMLGYSCLQCVLRLCVCVCVSVRERQRDRETERDREREREGGKGKEREREKRQEGIALVLLRNFPSLT